MSATPRKPGTPVGSNRSSMSGDNNNAVNGSTLRGHTRSPSATTNGLSRSPSTRGSTPVSARAAARKPGRSNLSMSNVPKITDDASEEEEARAQNAALIADLKEQLQKAETASEQYRKQLGVLQMRLDEAVSEQGKLEDQAHEKDSKIEALNSEIREHVRQIRDLEQTHEMERNAMLQEKEQQASREEEMQATVQRLKESLAQKEMRIVADGERNVSRSSSFRNRSSPELDAQFAPSSAQLERSPSRNNSKLLLQKDKLIESLRLELAESQIKLVEMENMGGGRQRELEKELLEARMANARLMEDNESYQLLLSERTLNGDFAKGDFMREIHPDSQEASSSGLGSLADELQSVDENAETDSPSRKLETEVRTLKDQNKALTLYIERIISRLLQHDGFEAILDRNESDPPAKKPAPSSVSSADKDLPPTPPEKEDLAGQSFLQRAKSVVSGQPLASKPRPRPMSFMPPTSNPAPTAHENPDTAPSIPISRATSVRAGHRRTRSEQTDGAAAAVIGQMYRGRNSGGPISPTTMGPGSRQSVFSGTPSYISSMGASHRAASLSSHQDPGRFSSSNSVSSDLHGDTVSTGATSSPPRSSSGMTNYTGAVMTQSKLRPLRLVQENNEAALEDEAARKKANRASWMPGWFNRSNTEEMA
ncbi:hypothetical protein ASPZODRAFT_126472 [Penicilliopsis zonata CBS 506.65]|uniref:M protein, serotype 2.1 n=1 Tax=Penicilliopsis zonata CBS 506.65 TaxID=1073090 RepID=A0A1L9STP8_9EURO|nr:hypothetical protein ASPZODRAFT_126472 [Penicilliopsis zonata CBS 506.65]OJJ50582.1 hypothetical protein ASPZODRAFT_126472 [Penicilliopsis zonata CBS 506.65]